MSRGTADVGVIGLAVMGANLALNMSDHGHVVAVYNRSSARTEEYLAEEAAGTSMVGAASLEELVAATRRPRRIVMMIKAGGAVDSVIGQLAPLLAEGDVIIDGGNSRYTDTQRRTAAVEEQGLLYIGMGVSGGELGARYGPSLMPGGSPEAWPRVKEMLQGISAKLDDGTPCCDWVGSDGAGHFVKMVHNGIEYADMQLIAEAYHLMASGLALGHDQIADAFGDWNHGKLDSYLIEITADILRYRQDGEPLVDQILDVAGQKGTGRWTVISSMDLGSPVAMVAEAVYARALSAIKEERENAASVLHAPSAGNGLGEVSIGDIQDALYGAKIVAYTQGFMLLAAASAEHGWGLDFGSIATIWRGGTIIRSAFLEEIRNAYRKDRTLANLLLDSYFGDEVMSSEGGLRKVVAAAAQAGVPVPAYSSALAFFDGYRSARLPANLIQAQRDYFGAHTYERIDAPRGEFFHTDWTGEGGDTTAGSYTT